jgi:hypothetical protein
MYIAALFVVARSWIKPRYLTTEEWVQKMSIYTMEYYYSATLLGLCSFRDDAAIPQDTGIPREFKCQVGWGFRIPHRDSWVGGGMKCGRV